MSARYSFALGLAALATPAWASQVPASSLLEDCHAHVSAPESIPAIRCEAYLRGFLDAANAVDLENERTFRTPFGSRVARLPSRPVSFCLPANTTLGGIIELLLGEESDPAAVRGKARELLLEVLARHFPCTQPARKPSSARNPAPDD